MLNVATLSARLTVDTKSYLAGMKQAKREQQSFVQQTKQAGASAGKAGDQAAAAANKTAGAMSRASMSAKQFGSAMTRNVTLPLLAVGAGALKLAVDFEDAFAKIDGLVGGFTDGELERMKQSVLGMAHETAQAPGKLADALYFVTSAGFGAAEALDIVETSAKAATSGLGDTATIADAVTSVVNAYGKANITAAEAVDVMTGAIAVGKFEADALAPVLGRIVPIASAMGIEFEQVGGILAVMSKSGLDASEAVTSLRGIMTQLLSPSEQAKNLYSQLGTSIEEVRKRVADDGLLPVLRDLWEQTGRNQSAFAVLFPEVRGLAGAMNVLGQDAGSVDKAMAQVADSTGMSDRAFRIMTETAGYKMKQALADLQTEGIKLGDTLVPVALSLVGHLQSLLLVWRDLPEPIRQVTLVGLGTLAIVGPLVKIGLAVKAIGVNAQAAALKLRAMATAHPILAAIAAATAVATALFLRNAKARADQERAEESYYDALVQTNGALLETIGLESRKALVDADQDDDLARMAKHLTSGRKAWDVYSDAVAGNVKSQREIRRAMVASGEIVFKNVAGAKEAKRTWIETGEGLDAVYQRAQFLESGHNYKFWSDLTGQADLATSAAERYAAGVKSGVIDTAEPISAALGLASTSLATAGEAAVAAATGMDAASEAGGILGTEFDASEPAVSRLAAALDEADAAAKRMSDTFAYAFGAGMDVTRASIDYRESMVGLTDALKDNESTQDDIVGTALDMFENIGQVREAMVTAGSSADDANAAFGRMTAEMLATMLAGGATQQELLTVISALLNLKGIKDITPYIKPDGTVDVFAALAAITGKLDEAEAANVEIDINKAQVDAADSKLGDVNQWLVDLNRRERLRIRVDSGELDHAFGVLGGILGKMIDIAARGITIAVEASQAPGRAAGGPVNAGGTYMVGEKGPELFMPAGDGQIIDAERTRSMLAGQVKGHADLYRKMGTAAARAYAEAMSAETRRAKPPRLVPYVDPGVRGVAALDERRRGALDSFTSGLGTVLDRPGQRRQLAETRRGMMPEQDRLQGLLAAVGQQGEFEDALAGMTKTGRDEFANLAKRAGLKPAEINDLLRQIPGTDTAGGGKKKAKAGGEKAAGDTITINLKAGVIGDGRQVGEYLANELARWNRRGGSN